MTVLWACDPVPDDGPDLTETTLSTEAAVSNLISRTPPSAIRASILAAEGGDNLVYVSLPVGAVPTGVRAEVRRKGDEVPVITKMQDGGFDPVTVEAAEGDSIEIVVKSGSGQVLFTTKEGVKAKRPPTVVRTWPPRKKADMPVNASMVVVISEPVDKRTVTSGSVRLFAGRSEILGQARVLDDGTSVAFTPTDPLSPQREYRLELDKSIADLEGEALGEGVVLGFRTGTSTLGPPASIVVSPDSIVALAGSTYQFSAKVFDAAGNLLLTPVTWHSAPLDVVTVSPTGLVSALQTRIITEALWANGRIEARVGTLVDSAYIAVVPKPASIQILPDAATLGIGDTLALEVVTRASNDVFSSRIMVPLTVSSSNPAAASISVPSLGAIQVSPFRTLKALAPGTTRITVKAGGISAASDITITAQGPVDTVRVAPAVAEIAVGETLQLTAWLRDASSRHIQDARAVSWSSSNALVLTVSGTGQVTAVSNGTATVTAASEGKASSASVTVSAQPLEPKFVEVTAQFWRTCGVTSARDTYCWGRFHGPGSVIKDLRVPTLLLGGLTLVAMTPGGNANPAYLCGRAEKGETFCWNYYNSIPHRFAQTLRFSDLSASEFGHACGVATNGNTYCWGVNTDGQLGDGTTELRPGTPTAVIGGHVFKSVAVGRSHSCGITVAGDAYCWGSNRFWLGRPEKLFVRGILGSGDLANDAIPTPTPVVGNLKFAQLSAAIWHTCGLTTDGKAYCWGFNEAGQIGDGTQTDRSVPVAVATSLTFTAISASATHTCAIATGGAAYCWGPDELGQLGVENDASCQQRLCTRPVAVQGNLSFVRITVGAYYACGITTSGRTYCWGDNSAGKLGDGTTVNRRAIPAPVARPNP